MITFTETNESRVFYVIFDKYRGRKGFWNYFTTKNFDHVYLLTDIRGQAFAITPTPSECLIDLWHCTIDEAIAWMPSDTTAILRYVSKYNSLKLFTMRGSISCVSLVKYFLGVNGITITPRRLHQQLLKLGAEHVK